MNCVYVRPFSWAVELLCCDTLLLQLLAPTAFSRALLSTKLPVSYSCTFGRSHYVQFALLPPVDGETLSVGLTTQQLGDIYMSTGDGAGSEDDGGAAQTAETRSWSQRGERRIIRMDEWLAFTGHTNALSLSKALVMIHWEKKRRRTTASGLSQLCVHLLHWTLLSVTFLDCIVPSTAASAAAS